MGEPIRFLRLKRGGAPKPSPYEAEVRVYANEDGVPHTLQHDGTDTAIGSGGSGDVPFVGTDPPDSPTDGELWWDPDDDTPTLLDPTGTHSGATLRAINLVYPNEITDPSQVEWVDEGYLGGKRVYVRVDSEGVFRMTVTPPPNAMLLTIFWRSPGSYSAFDSATLDVLRPADTPYIDGADLKGGAQNGTLGQFGDGIAGPGQGIFPFDQEPDWIEGLHPIDVVVTVTGAAVPAFDDQPQTYVTVLWVVFGEQLSAVKD